MSFDDERPHRQEQAAKVRACLTEFLDECGRCLERAEQADMTQREAAVKYLRSHRGKAFRARSIQVATEAKGMAFGSFYSVSVALNRLKQEGRVRQIGHGMWTVP